MSEKSIHTTIFGKESFSCKISGMDCPTCASTLEKGLKRLDGVNSVEVDYVTETLKVEGKISPELIYQRVSDLGYKAEKPETIKKDDPEKKVDKGFIHFVLNRDEDRLALLGVILVLPGLVLGEILGYSHWSINLAALAAMLLAGFPVFKSAFNAIKISREINMNVLMTIAAVGAVIIGAYVEAGMVMVLFAFGEALEDYSSERTRLAIQSLFDVLPARANKLVYVDGTTEMQEVGLEELQVGDKILVKPGEKIPMDGKILSGFSSVNQAPITGENLPVEKGPETQVLAGSINGEGVLEILVSHLAADNTISRMIRLVEEAQSQKANSQRFVDRFARYYTPVIVVLAFLTASIPPLFFNQAFLNPSPEIHGWFYRGLAVLIVGCPCALVISTPVTIISAVSRAARAGVLIKGGIHLETLSKVKAVAFDKTGTLTEGNPYVVNIRSTACDQHHSWQSGLFCQNCHDLLGKAAALEVRSEHPLGRAILRKVEELDLQRVFPTVDGVRALSGQGITGRVAGHSILVGSHSYFDQNIPHHEGFCRLAREVSQNGQTPLMVSEDGSFMGLITIADLPRTGSKEAIRELKSLGIKELVMLSGDQKGSALKIAENIGLTDVQAELMPQEKMARIKALQENYVVAMVGDGINDAPALAQANVGIAVGGALGGTAQAIETADITLMSGTLSRLPFVIRLSREAMRTVKLNVILALGIKLFFFLLVLAGKGTMWMAVFADTGTTLLVTLIGMRLLHWGNEEGFPTT